MSYGPETIAGFKKMLLTQKAEITAILRNNHSTYVEELNGAEREDRPQTTERHNAGIVICQSQLRDIENALDKCEAGTFGHCSDCGQLILLARLEAYPSASLCMSCHAKPKKEAKITQGSLLPGKRRRG